MIVFENPGEIDVAAISTFGVSVKETDNPIGFFGTGLKYAIAVLLRTGHTITIYSGVTDYTFGVQSDLVRGKSFDFVTMAEAGRDMTRIGFTTEVGKTWELWMAYRELFCNARDENGEAYVARERPEPCPDKTFVVVEGPQFEAVHTNRWQYFIEDNPDHEIDGIQIWERPSGHFFYRGVRVSTLPIIGQWTYNETRAMALTEDRTAKEQYMLPYRIARAFLGCQDERLLRKVLLAPAKNLEGNFDYHGWGTDPSHEFLRVVGELVNDGLTDVNSTARRLWKQKQPNNFEPKIARLTVVQTKTLERAIAFCVKIGFPVETYPIKVAESLGTDTLGLAKDKTIYIAERAFHMDGGKQVASTLIEEFIHLRFGYEDCTRPMQNWLFERMVSLGEELVGEPI